MTILLYKLLLILKFVCGVFICLYISGVLVIISVVKLYEM